MNTPQQPLAAPSPLPSDIAALSFEAAMAELDALVRTLESGTGQLDAAIQSYERGTLLRQHCANKLREAEARIDRITKTADGSIALQPVETL